MGRLQCTHAVVHQAAPVNPVGARLVHQNLYLLFTAFLYRALASAGQYSAGSSRVNVVDTIKKNQQQEYDVDQGGQV